MKSLLKELRENEIYISLQGEDLKLNFEESTPSPDLIAKIKENKQEIMEYLEQETKKDTTHVDIPKATLSAEGYPLSSAQLRLWILSQMEESSITYNMPLSVLLENNYDLPLFKKAIASVFDRHEILRTVFRANDKREVRQWVLTAEELDIPLDYMDLSAEEEPEKMAFSIVEKDYYLPFDLVNGPLVRMKLLKIGEGKELFYYNMHHIISDGWSMGVLSRDTMEFYNALLEQRAPVLSELEIQYKDYAAWQLGQLNSSSNADSKNYWLSKLEGDLPVFELLSSKKRPQIKTYNGSRYVIQIPNNQLEKLRNFVDTRESTLFIGLMAVLKVLFHKYTNQQDLIIGTPIAGRNHIDLEDQIGFYVNTLAIRSSCEPELTFEAFFDLLKDTIFDAFQNQRYPFDSLVDDLKIRRDSSRSAIFDVMLVLQNLGDSKNQLGFSEANKNPSVERDCQSKFDLLFAFEEYKEGLLLKLEYNTDIYHDDTIPQLVSHFLHLLEELPSQPKHSIKEISYLTPSDIDELNSFNATEFDVRKETVVSLFSTQVLKTPDAPAVLFGDEILTYQEIEAMSNQLASMLITDYGIGSGDLVGVMLRRSIHSVVAMIGVLKTGACYVPIDYQYPDKRIAHICKDSDIALMLITEDLNPRISDLSLKTVFVSDDVLMNYSTDVVDNSDLEAAAFIIYTSGSTGVPKGVIQTHKMLNNLIEWDINESGIGTGLRYLQYASFHFDASLHDIFFTLCSSGSVYITNDMERLDYTTLKEVILSKSIEVLSFPYSALINFFQQHAPSSFSGHVIKHIVSTAEQLYVGDSLMAFLNENPDIYLHNHYGPSETHVVTSHTMSIAEGTVVYRPTIGKPIINSTIHILDASLSPVGIGIKGELYIGGYNLAEGYLNLLDQTNARFITHPQDPNSLLYKTGDFGYWKKDGTIEYLGREDKQVKIRGYRIELDEIINNLIKLEGVEDALVLVKSNSSEDYLCAYVVVNSSLDMRQVRRQLEKTLPSYMIPSFFIKLETIPLTSNGKINKKLLPSPLSDGIVEREEYVAPKNDIEAKIVDIWKELLERDKIGITEDFFELGGHSLKLIKLVNSYYEILSAEVKLRDLFVLTTIEKHAELIGVQGWLQAEESEPDEHNEVITF